MSDDNVQDEKEQPPAKQQKKQMAPAKNWVFTDQDSSQGRQEAWKQLIHSTISKLAFQVEISPTTQKEHLQGCFELKKKARPTTFFRGPHYEKQRGTNTEASAYATKDDTRKPGCEPFIYGYPAKIVLWTKDDICDCQATICELFLKRCDPKKDRVVHWF